MTKILQLGDRTPKRAEVLPLLAENQILLLLMRSMIIDIAIAQIPWTANVGKLASQRLVKQYQWIAKALRQPWLQQHRMSAKQFDWMAICQLQLEKLPQSVKISSPMDTLR